jgi:hypothetical protein
MKWQEAHNRLDAGIPIKQEEWPAIERSLRRFYGGCMAAVVVMSIAIPIIVTWLK